MKPILQYRHLIFLLKFLEVTERKNIKESKKKVCFLKCSFSVIKDIASVGKSYLFFSYKTINDKLMYIPNDDET